MNVQTFIFGNPDGWKLYNKDQSEVSYFKSFYVNSRRGPRLMVHRRDDGSVVYVWLMYGIAEKRKGGFSHIGFAMILPDNNYIPEFRLVYSFFSTLFYKMLERKDSPVGVNKSGEKLPYAYLIHKFDEAKPVMEWLRSNMPNVLKKCSLRSITDDREFSDELSGRIATLSDEATDGEILNAFKRNSWVAISPEYRTKTADVNAEATIELNLFDVTRLHTKLTGSLLEWAIAGSTISRKQMDDMLAKINDARGLLAAYVKNITDESEIKEVTHLQHEFSSLVDIVEQLKIKQDSLPVDTDYKVDPLPPDPPGPIDDRHDNVADKPLPGSQHYKNVALPYRLVGGVFVVIALLIIALVKCSGSDATKADDKEDMVPEEVTDTDTLTSLLTPGEVVAKAFNEDVYKKRLCNKLDSLLKIPNPTKENYDDAKKIVDVLKLTNYKEVLDAMLEKVQKAEAEARSKQTVETATVVPGNSEDLIVTYGEKSKSLGGRDNLGVEVYLGNVDIGNKIIIVDSNYPLGCEEKDWLRVDKKSKTSYALKVLKMPQAELKCMMTSEFMNKKGQKVQITITFIKKEK